ncbi:MULTISPECIES: hypothetical protein [Pseudonocardia]|jgi:hypothetical protein|uniref:Uncharacterized protein n=1 Tax=Pseudonocardia dioxanivorans (strain ATCC 55486 / DSM 44775 / JCM 13855 / CB1190) TaxID=675635 RepID=F4CZP4_PSEUX|nr:hypothetical protein [Pseudonocardia dioxanivorans]AEA26716.1 hypothetical protein Psed_4564 [Pseudonocardia dioxanivorans CB1190]GJF05829.1 hypothetical protein PSD17_47790 [Pseudonocardia sp. D17]
MGLVNRLRGARRVRGGRHIPEAEEAHLRAWAAAHHGVEAFVEPRTTVTDTTVVMVASDGSWTRRRVAGPQAARKLGRSLRIPVYDVQLVGYPQRMRDHDARERVLRERRRRADLQDRDDPQR